MPIEPVVAGLIGACLMICLPCLIPCCLSMALLPIPIVIVRNANVCRKCPKCPPDPLDPTTSYWCNFRRTAFQPGANGDAYDIHWTDSGVKWTKLEKPSIVSN